MPSKSKSQQRFFGMVDAYKKGKMKNASSKIKKAANSMSMKDVKDFAKTKHDGLPETVENVIKSNTVRLTESELHDLVKESVIKILNEVYNGGEDDELNDELNTVGATGEATPEQINEWEEDLWININKTLQNAQYLFNKTRDEKYAKIEEMVSGALDYFPDGEQRFAQVDYDPSGGYGG